MAKARLTKGEWFVRDFRASTMRRLGWDGPSIDRILIVDKTGPEIVESGGYNCVVARIQFDNRTEALDDGNLADAHMLAAAPSLYSALEKLLIACRQQDTCGVMPADKGLAYGTAEAALRKARGEPTEKEKEL